MILYMHCEFEHLDELSAILQVSEELDRIKVFDEYFVVGFRVQTINSWHAEIIDCCSDMDHTKLL